MNLLKSIYVSTFLTATMVLTGYAGWQLWQGGSFASPWAGALLAAGASSAFFMRLFLLPVARTGDRLWGVLGCAIAGTAVAAVLGGGAPMWLAATVGIAGTLLYDRWFSQFGERSTAVLAPGKTLPSFTLHDADGNSHSSQSLTDRPTIWMFYRGNWCPFCMAQVKEVAAQYRELEQRGAQVILISPQSEAHTRSLAKKFDVPMRFLIDVDNQAALALDVFAENGLPAGMQALGYDSDVPLPTVFITAPGGRILYADLTENYRIRPEPAEFLRVLDQAGAAA